MAGKEACVEPARVLVRCLIPTAKTGFEISRYSAPPTYVLAGRRLWYVHETRAKQIAAGKAAAARVRAGCRSSKLL